MPANIRMRSSSCFETFDVLSVGVHSPVFCGAGWVGELACMLVTLWFLLVCIVSACSPRQFITQFSSSVFVVGVVCRSCRCWLLLFGFVAGLGGKVAVRKGHPSFTRGCSELVQSSSFGFQLFCWQPWLTSTPSKFMASLRLLLMLQMTEERPSGGDC